MTKTPRKRLHSKNTALQNRNSGRDDVIRNISLKISSFAEDSNAILTCTIGFTPDLSMSDGHILDKNGSMEDPTGSKVISALNKIGYKADKSEFSGDDSIVYLSLVKYITIPTLGGKQRINTPFIEEQNAITIALDNAEVNYVQSNMLLPTDATMISGTTLRNRFGDNNFGLRY